MSPSLEFRRVREFVREFEEPIPQCQLF